MAVSAGSCGLATGAATRAPWQGDLQPSRRARAAAEGEAPSSSAAAARSCSSLVVASAARLSRVEGGNSVWPRPYVTASA